MPRSGVNGTYSLPPGTTPQQPNTVIQSSVWNAAMDDIAQTQNTPLPVPYGGTGSATIDGARTSLGAFGVIRVTGFGTSGTFTPNANMLWCIIEAVGGGGGGGGVAGQVGFSLQGGSGGGGSYSRKIVPRSSIPGPVSVTVGVAGSGAAPGFNNGTSGTASSVGGFITANGGIFGEAVSSGFVGGPALGGALGVGDLVTPGYRGNSGFIAPAGYIAYTAKGADSVWGTGGAPLFNSTGQGAQSFGAGGGGGFAVNVASNYGGGAGSGGLVLITEFCSE